MQTRANAENVVYFRQDLSPGSQRSVGQIDRQKNNQKASLSQKPKIRKAKVQMGRQESKSKNKSKSQNHESEMRINQKGLSKLEIKTKGVVYYISINWLTQNRHRIKINVLMAGVVCTD